MIEPPEAQWQRQEAACQGTAGDAAYRLIAQALAQPIPVQLPADFAAQMARLATARSAAAAASFEWMLVALALALTVLAAWVALHFNPDLAAGLVATTARTLASQDTAGWLLWLLAGLAAASIRPQRITTRRPQ